MKIILVQKFIGTYDRGLIGWSESSYTTIDDENRTVWSSAMDVFGSNWFGTGSGLVQVRNGKKVKTWKIADGLLLDKITCLLKIDYEKMLIGGSGGLMLYDKGQISVLQNNSKNDIGTIRNLCYFKKQLYIASDKGFHCLYKGEPTIVSDFYRTTYSLGNHQDEFLWLGTEEGLFRYDGKKIEKHHL